LKIELLTLIFFFLTTIQILYKLQNYSVNTFFNKWLPELSVSAQWRIEKSHKQSILHIILFKKIPIEHNVYECCWENCRKQKIIFLFQYTLKPDLYWRKLGHSIYVSSRIILDYVGTFNIGCFHLFKHYHSMTNDYVWLKLFST
jgi:hypothetical protein